MPSTRCGASRPSWSVTGAVPGSPGTSVIGSRNSRSPPHLGHEPMRRRPSAIAALFHAKAHDEQRTAGTVMRSGSSSYAFPALQRSSMQKVGGSNLSSHRVRPERRVPFVLAEEAHDGTDVLAEVR